MSGEGKQEVAQQSAAETSPLSPGSTSPQGKGGIPGPKTVILVDVSNVSYGSQTGGNSGNSPKIDNLKQVLSRIEGFSVEVVPLADASLRHKIDRKSELEGMFASGSVNQAPAGTSADDFLWQLWKSYRAKGARAFIVTNDQFPLTNARAESVAENPRITFLFHAGDIFFQPPIESILTVSLPPTLTPTLVGSPGVATDQAEGEARGNSLARDAVHQGPEWVVSRSASSEVGPTGETRTQSHAELIASAIEVIAALTQPPGGIFRRVNFATVSHDLHQKFKGDFVTEFGLGKPKDLAEELAERGLVTISYTNTTMYVEPTLAFEGRIIGRRFPRRQLGPGGEAAIAPQNNAALPAAAAKPTGELEGGVPEGEETPAPRTLRGASLKREILLHLLEYRGQQIRFEASQWTTEFGILRKFSDYDPDSVKQALRNLEMSRMIYRRTQYVVGYSEAKHVFSLTPSGHKQALAYRRGELTSSVSASNSMASEHRVPSESIAASPTPLDTPTVTDGTVRFCGQCGAPVVSTSRLRTNVCSRCEGPIVIRAEYGSTTPTRECTPPRDDSPPDDDDDDTHSYSDDHADDNPAEDWQSDSND
jgi:DNA-directed RNA polymerase subunit RPC12/RpoP